MYMFLFDDILLLTRVKKSSRKVRLFVQLAWVTLVGFSCFVVQDFMTSIFSYSFLTSQDCTN